jgi:hypothetical protein
LSSFARIANAKSILTPPASSVLDHIATLTLLVFLQLRLGSLFWCVLEPWDLSFAAFLELPDALGLGVAIFLGWIFF